MTQSYSLPDRSELLTRLAHEEIAARYRNLWGEAVGLEEAVRHAQLEGELTDAVLATTPDNRATAFENAYSRLYAELPWMNSSEAANNPLDLRAWKMLIGRGKTILEIGSGRGQLIRYLGAKGNVCHATEITRERGEKFVESEAGVQWLVSDGVNLSRFAQENFYDVVISDQVFEHLHPEDHVTHLAEARKLLKDGGRYILRAPHRATGPHDISAVFGFDRAVFLHLCEPDYGLMERLTRAAGFRTTRAVVAKQRLGIAVASRLVMLYQIWLDRIERRADLSAEARRRVRHWTKPLLVGQHVWIVAEK